MSDSGGSEQRKFCTSCGNPAESGKRFCANCGASLGPGQTNTETESASTSPSESKSFAYRIGRTLSSLSRSLKERRASSSPGSSLKERLIGLSTPSGNTWKGTPRRLLSWFRDLPSVLKLIIAGLLVIVLIVILSPLIRIAALLTFIVSTVILIIRVVQRKPVMQWAALVAASLLLVPVLGVASNLLYDNEGGSNTVEVATGDSLDDDDSETFGDSLSDDGSETSVTTEPELSYEEEEYLSNRVEIIVPMTFVTARQTDLYNFCLETCGEGDYEKMENAELSNSLLSEAQSLSPPDGYEDSHAAFTEWAETAHEINYRIGSFSIGGAEGDSLVEDFMNDMEDMYYIDSSLPTDALNYQEDETSEFLADNPEYSLD